MTAFYANDPDMIKAYKEGKDLYSVVASSMYNNNYEDNLEFYPEGTKVMFEGKLITCGKKTHLNKAGKARRFEAKSVLIGLLYGRGAASIAEQINENRKDPNNICTIKDAQEIMDKFFKAYPTVKKWIEGNQQFARDYGYVEDWYGRRRRLPDINLPKFEVKQVGNAKEANFNPLLECENKADMTLINKYQELLNKTKYKKEIDEIKRRAIMEGIEIRDNGGFIAQAERQCTNARVQGGSATLTKLAMINIDKDERLKRLGFQLLITVHDEVIGECPEENAEEVSHILPEIMIKTAADYITTIPMSCDPYIVKAWYEDENQNALEEEFKKYVNGDKKKGILPLGNQDAFDKLVINHPEMLRENLRDIINALID